MRLTVAARRADETVWPSHVSRSRRWRRSSRPPPATTAIRCCRASCSRPWRASCPPTATSRGCATSRITMPSGRSPSAPTENEPSEGLVAADALLTRVLLDGTRTFEPGVAELRASTIVAPGASVGAAPIEVGSSRLGALGAIRADGAAARADPARPARARGEHARPDARRDRGPRGARADVRARAPAGVDDDRQHDGGRRAARPRAGRGRRAPHGIVAVRGDPARRALPHPARGDGRRCDRDDRRSRLRDARAAPRRVRAGPALARRAVPPPLAARPALAARAAHPRRACAGARPGAPRRPRLPARGADGRGRASS